MARGPVRVDGPGAATISDVASAAGVSRATVSRVMNGSRVDPDLTKRVRAAATSLNYRPSATARSLSLGRTQAVGIVVPDLTNPMFQAVLRSVTAGADRARYSVVVAETAGRDEREREIALATRARCDALVLVSPRMDGAQLTALVASLAPVVLVNRPLPGNVHVPNIGLDFAAAMLEVLTHLVGLGHRRIVFLSGPSASASNAARLAGLESARAAFPGVEFLVLPGGVTLAEGHARAGAVVASEATAVAAFNDLVAFGLLAGLAEAGVDVPGQISVVGFDDIELARYAVPPLTTVRVRYDEIGALAWDRLRALAAPTPGSPDAGSGHGADASGDVLVPTEFCARASTAPPTHALVEVSP